MSAGCGCGGACGCGKAKTAESPAASGIKNGKGSAPRNISVKFRKNFDSIKWSAKRGAKSGVKFVKTY